MAEYQIVIKVVGKDEASGPLGNVSSAIGNLAQIAGGNLIANAVSGGISMVGDLARQVLDAGIGFNSLKEQATIAFTTMLGDGQKATAMIRDLAKFAADTPFEFPDLLVASQNLVAVGIGADRVIPIMTALGDSTAAMGTGAEGINRATRALQQMGTLGRVTGQDMLQLTSAGIPAWDALSAAIGKSVSETQDLVSKGMVPAEAMFHALETNAGASLQRVKGMMDEQAKSFGGMLSTLQDNFTQAAGKITEPLFNKLREGMGKLNQLFDSPAIKAGIQNFAKSIASGLDSVISFVTGTLLPALQSVFGFIVQNAELVKAVLLGIGAVLAGAAILGPILGIGAAILALLNPITLVIAAIGLLASAWAGNWGNIQGVVGQVLAFLQPALLRIAQIIQGQIVPALQSLGGFINTTVVPALRALWEWLGPKLTQVITTIAGLLAGAVVKAIQDLANWLILAAKNAQEFARVFGESIKWVVERVFDLLKILADAYDLMGSKAIASGIRQTVAGMQTAFQDLTLSIQDATRAAHDHGEALSGPVTRAITTTTGHVLTEADALRREQLEARGADAASRRAANAFTQMGNAGLTAAKGIDIMAKVAEKVRGIVEQALQPTSVQDRLQMAGDAWDEFRLRLDAINTGTPLDAYGPAFVEQVQKMQEITGLALPDIAAKFKDFSLFANMDWLKGALDAGAVDLGPIKEKINQTIQSIIGFANLAKAAFDDIWASMDTGTKIDLAKALGLDAGGANIEALKTSIQGAVTGAMSGVTAETLPGTQGAQLLGTATGTLATNIKNSATSIGQLTPLLKPLETAFASILPKVTGLNPPLTILGGLWSAFRKDTADLVGLLATAKTNLESLSAVIAGKATADFTAFTNNVAIPLRNVFEAISWLLGDIQTQLEGIAAILSLMKPPPMLERNSPSPLEMALMNSNMYLKEMKSLLPGSLGVLGGLNLGGPQLAFAGVAARGYQSSAPSAPTAIGSGGITIHGGVHIVAHDYEDFKRQLYDRVTVEERWA